MTHFHLFFLELLPDLRHLVPLINIFELYEAPLIDISELLCLILLVDRTHRLCIAFKFLLFNLRRCPSLEGLTEFKSCLERLSKRLSSHVHHHFWPVFNISLDDMASSRSATLKELLVRLATSSEIQIIFDNWQS